MKRYDDELEDKEKREKEGKDWMVMKGTIWKRDERKSIERKRNCWEEESWVTIKDYRYEFGNQQLSCVLHLETESPLKPQPRTRALSQLSRTPEIDLSQNRNVTQIVDLLTKVWFHFLIYQNLCNYLCGSGDSESSLIKRKSFKHEVNGDKICLFEADFQCFCERRQRRTTQTLPRFIESKCSKSL